MSKKHTHHDAEPNPEATAAAPDARQDDRDQIIEQLQIQIEKLQAELAEATDKMLRFRADTENTQRRARIDIENAHKYGIEKLARELLNVVDGLDRGLEVHRESEHQQLELMREGMELTHKLLLDTLERFGIKQINPVGEAFDPKQHEALTTQATTEIEPNKILTVVQKGFAIHDRILRPARVVVAKAPEDVAS